MAIEIELKYLVEGKNVAHCITSLLKSEKVSFKQSEKTLINHYFETTTLNLRQHDMGLRVRESDGMFEQTIKTAGKVIGGLHQRPEFNVDINSNFPELALFPSELWHEDQNVTELQEKILSIFTTNFKRTIWLITADNGSEIELVFDEGTIETSGKIETICEIELELVSGEPADIFNVADRLFTSLLLRSGIKSKAARGYALWQDTPQEFLLKGENVLPITHRDSIESAFIHGVSQSLQNFQYAIEHYLSTQELTALVDITNVLAKLRHGFWLFETETTLADSSVREELSYFIKLLSWADSAIHLNELNTNTGNYRSKVFANQQLVSQLTSEQQQFPAFSEVATLIQSARFNRLQLTLLKIALIESGDSASELSAHKSEKDERGMMDFAKESLNKALDNLVILIDQSVQLNIDEYVNVRATLHRSMFTGSWLGGVFVEDDNNARAEYRSAWLDVQKGLSELQVLWVLAKKLKNMQTPSSKLTDWHQRKVEGLLLALEHSRKYALDITPYWKIH